MDLGHRLAWKSKSKKRFQAFKVVLVFDLRADSFGILCLDLFRASNISSELPLSVPTSLQLFHPVVELTSRRTPGAENSLWGGTTFPRDLKPPPSHLQVLIINRALGSPRHISNLQLLESQLRRTKNLRTSLHALDFWQRKMEDVEGFFLRDFFFGLDWFHIAKKKDMYLIGKIKL